MSKLSNELLTSCTLKLFTFDNLVVELGDYTFGLIGGVYAKKKDIKDDIIKIVGQDYEYYLQRYYG